MKGVSVVLVVCGLSSGFAAPAARVGLLGLALGRQGLANTGIDIGSMATNMATGLAGQALGSLGGIPIFGPFAQMGQAAVETGNSFAQMGLGIGRSVVNGFSGQGNAASQLPTSPEQQIPAVLRNPIGVQQQTQLQGLAQQQAAQQGQSVFNGFSGLGTAASISQQQQQIQQQQQQQQKLQQQLFQALVQQQAAQQDGGVQQEASGITQTENYQGILGSPDLDSWWNPSPPQPVYIGN